MTEHNINFKGYIYLIEAEGCGRYKIGKTQDITARLESLQGRQSPFPLRLIASYLTDDCEREENRLHQVASLFRKHGEWFELPQEWLNDLGGWFYSGVPQDLWEQRLPKSRHEYLTKDDVYLLMKAAAKTGRHGHRDRALILLGYRHGFRVTELVGLKWSDIDFNRAIIRCARVKKSETTNHPLTGEELRALRQLQREYPDSQWLFVSEQKQPLSRRTAHAIVARAGEVAEFSFPTHPHMLRHACGYQLAATGTDTRAIQEYLGHKSITHTVRYTALAPGRFSALVERL